MKGKTLLFNIWSWYQYQYNFFKNVPIRSLISKLLSKTADTLIFNWFNPKTAVIFQVFFFQEN